MYLVQLFYSWAKSIVLTSGALADKPALANIVVAIFATWAQIEHELSLLLIRVLGANAKPTIAMYDALRANNVRMDVLDAAAYAALPTEEYAIFDAVLSAAKIAQKERNKLAHWVWERCDELPDALLLADPSHLRNRSIETTRFQMNPAAVTEPEVVAKLYAIDEQNTFVYKIGDLERAHRDLASVSHPLFWYSVYMNPIPDGDPPQLREARQTTAARALAALMSVPLVRDVLDRPTK